MKRTKLIVALVLAVALAGVAGLAVASAGSTMNEPQANAMDDADGDGIRNWADADYALPILAEDRDGDGVPNGEDADWPKYAYFLDDDGDGIRNGGDADYALPILSEDRDGDGVLNGEDPDWTLPLFLADDDGDGIRNSADVDYDMPLRRERHRQGGCGTSGPAHPGA